MTTAEDRQHDLDKIAATAEWEIEKAVQENELAMSAAFHAAILEVSKGGIERGRDNAKYIQTAATAVVAIYTGLLGFVYSVTDNPLPVRGLYAAVFFGLAIAFATTYLAFAKRAGSVDAIPATASLSDKQFARTFFFVRWVTTAVRNKRWFIRASVISLAAGVAFIPAAFIAPSPVPELPAAPTLPDIPTEFADELEPSTIDLYQGEIDRYLEAVEARNAAVVENEAQQAALAIKQDRLNGLFFWLAVLTLWVVIAVPSLFEVLGGDGERIRPRDLTPLILSFTLLAGLLLFAGTRSWWWPAL